LRSDEHEQSGADTSRVGVLERCAVFIDLVFGTETSERGCITPDRDQALGSGARAWRDDKHIAGAAERERFPAGIRRK
jgi:hypothetical protein